MYSAAHRRRGLGGLPATTALERASAQRYSYCLPAFITGHVLGVQRSSATIPYSIETGKHGENGKHGEMGSSLPSLKKSYVLTMNHSSSESPFGTVTACFRFKVPVLSRITLSSVACVRDRSVRRSSVAWSKDGRKEDFVRGGGGWPSSPPPTSACVFGCVSSARPCL